MENAECCMLNGELMSLSEGNASLIIGCGMPVLPAQGSQRRA